MRIFKILPRLVALPICVVLTLVASGCTDRSGNPLALAVASDAGGGLLLDDGIGTVPQILMAHGLADSVAPEIEAWEASWEMGPAEGQALREPLYAPVARRLFSRLGRSGTEDLLGRSSLALTVSQGLDFAAWSGPVASAVSRARSLHGEAREALRQGSPETALELVLRATDVMYQLSPGEVASDLLRRAQTVWGRIQGDPSYSERELIRIRRLMHGASEALDAQDYPGAIRRAYYACQLLGVGPS